MKQECLDEIVTASKAFSTLDSGLRDETPFSMSFSPSTKSFQYPRLGSTR